MTMRTTSHAQQETHVVAIRVPPLEANVAVIPDTPTLSGRIPSAQANHKGV